MINPNPPRPCPTHTQLRNASSTETHDPDILDHLRNCPACAAEFQALKEDEGFLKRARSIVSTQTAGAPHIPGYRVIALLSSGSHGIVYRAEQLATSRPVAIKIVHPDYADDPRHRARAEREAEIVAALHHPGIVTLYECRSLPDARIAIVMELVEGVPITEWRPPGKTQSEKRRATLEVFIRLCLAVHYAHLNAVIHRDLKPENIRVREDAQPVVLDFGVARARSIGATRTGEFAGTPAYASPEQAAAQPGSVDALSDVYSLSVILYQLLTHRLPYTLEGSILEMARTIALKPPRPPRIEDPSIHQDLEAIVLKGLQKDKRLRYQSAAGLARDIERYLSGMPVDARAGSGWYFLHRALVINRRRLAWTAAAVALLLLSATVVILSLLDAADAAQRADRDALLAHKQRIRAQAVTEVMREALPSPDRVPQEVTDALTAGLGRLYQRLESGAFSAEPDLDQEIRRIWGEIYTGFGADKGVGNLEYAEVSLRNGLINQRIQHPKHDTLEIAQTLHELAGVLLVRVRLTEARDAASQALDIRQRILTHDHPLTLESHAILARIALADNDHNHANSHAQTVLNNTAPRPTARERAIRADMHAILTRIALQQHRFDAADQHAAALLTTRIELLPPDDPAVIEALDIISDLAAAPNHTPTILLLAETFQTPPQLLAAHLDAITLALRIPEPVNLPEPIHTGRTHALSHILALQQRLLPPDAPALVSTHFALARAARTENQGDTQIQSLLNAAQLLLERNGPADLSALTCLQEAANAAAFADNAPRAVQIQHQACEIWNNIPTHAHDPVAHANSLRRYAWYLALDQQWHQSLRAHHTALLHVRNALGDQHYLTGLTRAGLALAKLHHNDPHGADADSRDALTICREFPSTPLDALAHAHFIRGHILHKLHESPEAKTLLQDAWNIAYHSLGPDFPWRHQLASDLAHIARSEHDHSAETLWSRRSQRNSP